MDKIVNVILTPSIRHAMTAAAGALVAAGILSQQSSGAFVEVATGLAIGAAGFAWSLIKNAAQHRR